MLRLSRQYCQHQPARLELTLAILKPDLVQHSPHHQQVQQMILQHRFLVVRSNIINLSRARQQSTATVSIFFGSINYSFILIEENIFEYLLTPEGARAEEFYSEHREKFFYNRLVMNTIVLCFFTGDCVF